MRLLGDTDPDGTRQNLLKMVSVMQRIPEMIVVPAAFSVPGERSELVRERTR